MRILKNHGYVDLVTTAGVAIASEVFSHFEIMLKTHVFEPAEILLKNDKIKNSFSSDKLYDVKEQYFSWKGHFLFHKR